ncbi:MAG: PTS sugar transporter subunit IIA [Spirochaetales bacterium]|nr:PTS sugar transporter subunit IIA [Spirochaetales bacterium]
MNDLTSFPDGTVVSLLNREDKYRAIHELILKTAGSNGVQDSFEFERAVVEREKLLSTGLGHGVALAHGKTGAVDRLCIALGFSSEGIDFDSPDGEPVHFLFVIGNPPEALDEYLEAIGAIARFMREPTFRDRLINTHSEHELEVLLNRAFDYEVHHHAS